MPSIPVSKIVIKLVKDELLIVEKTLFAQSLDTPVAERLQWETLYTMWTNSANAHFTILLEIFVQRMGEEANLRNLRNILISCDFISAFGKFTTKALVIH